MTDECDIAIVGAGAAGLATAIFAAEAARDARRVLKIVLLDGAKKIGAKILVSGGARCNVTHDAVTPDDFQGPRNVVRNVLRGFDEQATVRWMASLGVELKREQTGKMFPVSDDAHTVLDALLRRCAELGVEIRTDHRVRDIAPRKPGHGHAPPPEVAFTVHHTRGELAARRVVLATGGRSLPRTGSDGFGYELARKLGHTVTRTYPALAPLVLADGFFHAALSGVSHEAELSTYSDGKLIDRRAGSLLWTHFGVSGPLAMDASRFWVIAAAEGKRAELRCSLLPGASFESVEKWLIDAASRSPKRGVVNVLGDRLPQRVAEQLVRFAGLGTHSPPQRHPHPGPLPPSRERGQGIGQLGREARRRLVHAITALPLPVVRDRGWNYAEVTAGGVPMSEVDHRTMQSRRTPGLFMVGEILDVDGRIGGFNFQWAWSTAHAAGKGLTAETQRHRGDAED